MFEDRPCHPQKTVLVKQVGNQKVYQIVDRGVKRKLQIKPKDTYFKNYHMDHLFP